MNCRAPRGVSSLSPARPRFGDRVPLQEAIQEANRGSQKANRGSSRSRQVALRGEPKLGP